MHHLIINQFLNDTDSSKIISDMTENNFEFLIEDYKNAIFDKMFYYSFLTEATIKICSFLPNVDIRQRNNKLILIKTNLKHIVKDKINNLNIKLNTLKNDIYWERKNIISVYVKDNDASKIISEYSWNMIHDIAI